MKKIMSVFAAMVALCVMFSVASSAETAEAVSEPGFFESIAEFFERVFSELFGIDSPFRIVINWISGIIG